MKKISVVIPTFNRGRRISKVIERLLNQSVSQSNYELILVDNNSTDDTCKVIEGFVKRYPKIVRYFLQKKKGAAPTRNLGASQAAADIILFLDDDMIAEKNLISEHINAHNGYKGSVLGFFNKSW